MWFEKGSNNGTVHAFTRIKQEESSEDRLQSFWNSQGLSFRPGCQEFSPVILIPSLVTLIIKQKIYTCSSSAGIPQARLDKQVIIRIWTRYIVAVSSKLSRAKGKELSYTGNQLLVIQINLWLQKNKTFNKKCQRNGPVYCTYLIWWNWNEEMTTNNGEQS